MYKLQAPKIKLSPFSTIRAVAEGASVKVQNWKDEVADAGIIAGVTFFGTIGGTAATGAANIEGALIAAGSIFFTILALKRGLVKEE